MQESVRFRGIRNIEAAVNPSTKNLKDFLLRLNHESAFLRKRYGAASTHKHELMFWGAHASRVLAIASSRSRTLQMLSTLNSHLSAAIS
jgi:hypothetical protein